MKFAARLVGLVVALFSISVGAASNAGRRGSYVEKGCREALVKPEVSRTYIPAAFPLVDDLKIDHYVELYETTLEVAGANVWDDVVREVIHWTAGAQSLKGVDREELRRALRESLGSPFRLIQLGKAGRVVTVEGKKRGRASWAILLEHPDRLDPKQSYRVNIGLSRVDEDKLELTLNVNLWSERRIRSHPGLLQTCPRFVRWVLERDELKCFSGSLPISREPRLVTRQNVAEFVSMVRDPQRILPIVFVSLARSNGQPAIDPVALAHALRGFAVVFVEARTDAPAGIADLLGDVAPDLYTDDGWIRVLGYKGDVAAEFNGRKQIDANPPSVVLKKLLKLVVNRTIEDVTLDAEDRVTSVFDLLPEGRSAR